MSKQGIISITMIAVVAIILLTAVFLGNFNKNIVTEKAESRFVEIYSSPAYNTSEIGFKIYYDKETKVQYLEKTMDKGCGLTVMVDQEGKPLLYGGGVDI